MATITGTQADNFLSASSQGDEIYGLGGNDLLYGLGGNDLLDSGLGNDVAHGGDGDDTIFGADGDDFSPVMPVMTLSKAERAMT